MIDMDMSFAARIARGAEYLDEFYPGWETSVNLEILDMQTSNCVLGQVNNFDWGTSVDRLNDRRPGSHSDSGVHYTPAQVHGFSVTYSNQQTEAKEWEELDRKWRELITARRQA